MGFLIMPIGFKLLKTPFDWIDIALASVGAALASLIPTFGGPASFVITVAILYWRIGSKASCIRNWPCCSAAHLKRRSASQFSQFCFTVPSEDAENAASIQAGLRLPTIGRSSARE
jgi:hypothetical protein